MVVYMGKPSVMPWACRQNFGQRVEFSPFLAGSTIFCLDQRKTSLQKSLKRASLLTTPLNADAIIESKGSVDPTVVARHIMSWACKINAFDKNILGPTSKAALFAIEQGIPIEDIDANGVTNGSAMRVAPIGCLQNSADRDKFIETVRLSCLPTHKSDIAITGALVIAWAISRAIEGAPWHQIKQELIPLANHTQRKFESTFSPLLGKRIQYALSVVANQNDKKQGLTDLYEMVGAGMDIIESIPTAIALVELAGTEPMLCAELAANLGGDTDTIGAMATAICGAIQGIAAFDEKHIKLINNANDIDFIPYAHALAELRQQASL